MIDDKYLNGQAKICGWQATLVYTSLCRHANINQESFPSINLMSEEHGVSRTTIIKGIKNLEKYNVIEVGKMRNKAGKWLNNSYILTDKSDWIKTQVHHADTAPSPPQNKPKSTSEQTQVHHADTKETHRRKHIEGVSAKADGSSPRNLEEFIIWCKKSTQRHIHIIADYADEKKMQFETKDQWQQFLKRNLRPARSLSPYSDKQIGEAMTKLNEAKKDYLTDWTLETLNKFLDK